jgi:hypothetical protein
MAVLSGNVPFDLVHASHAGSGGEEMLRLRVYEKLQGLAYFAGEFCGAMTGTSGKQDQKYGQAQLFIREAQERIGKKQQKGGKAAAQTGSRFARHG